MRKLDSTLLNLSLHPQYNMFLVHMLTSWYHFEVIFTSLFQVDRLAQLYNIHLRTGCFCNIGACQMFLNISSEDIKTNLQVNLNIPLPTPTHPPLQKKPKTHKTCSQQCMSIAEHKMFVVCPMYFYLLIICLLIFCPPITLHQNIKFQTKIHVHVGESNSIVI